MKDAHGHDKQSGPGQSAAHGSLPEFAETYHQYYTRIFAYIYNRVDTVELAKDLTAEVFEKAYCKGGTLRDPEAYVAWLFTIAKNTIVGHFRKRKREANSLHRAAESLWLQDRSVDPVEGLVHDEQVAGLLVQLRTLSPREQEILALKFDAALRNRQISQVVGISEVNVRVTIFRALNKLRKKIEKEAGLAQ